MASPTRVSCINVLSSLFIIALTLQHSSLLVRGQPPKRVIPKIVYEVCHKTGANENLCIACCAPQASYNVGVREIAAFLLGCSNTASLTARQQVSDLCKNEKGKAQQDCFQCVRRLDAAILAIQDAGLNFGPARYPKVIDDLNQAHSAVGDCLSLVGSPSVSMLAEAEGDLEATINVVNQIPK